MKKIYLITYETGEYEDIQFHIHSCWSSKKLAEKEINRITTYGQHYDLEGIGLDVKGDSCNESIYKCNWPREPYSDALHREAIFQNNFLKQLHAIPTPIFGMPFEKELSTGNLIFHGLGKRYGGKPE